MQEINIVKVGGKVIDNEDARNAFLAKLANIKKNIVLVHGGGKVANQVLESMGIEPKMVNGRRITDAETLKVVTMVYTGLINKTITAKLNSFGRKSVGISGVDGVLLDAVKRPVKDIDYGFAGDITADGVNAQLLVNLVKDGYTPVIATIAADKNAQLLNINADTVASTLAAGLSKIVKTNLYFCFEKKGVLMNAEDDNSVIPVLNKQNYPELLSKGIFADGMIPKLENAFKTLEQGVDKVIIGNSNDIENFFSENHAGTLISK
ncbi:MAG: acetylglutamate kinase [Bacteroidales bacterium]|jgi:acetylglutamate kinase|nr:acetylglutamate kinase [Bacteroidales bacterium]